MKVLKLLLKFISCTSIIKLILLLICATKPINYIMITVYWIMGIELLITFGYLVFLTFKKILQIEEDLSKKVDLIREHKNIKPLLLKMIQKDITYV